MADIKAYVYLGWSPVLAVATTNGSAIEQVVGWIGGNGTAPVTGQYIGSNGFVTNITDGQNIGGGGGLSNIKISAGTASTNGSAFTFNNSNGVSFGLGTGANTGIITATVATNYQSQGAYLTTAMQSNAATISNINISAGASSSLVSALTFSNGSGVSWGYDGTNVTATVKTDYQSSGAYLTTAMQSNAATISNIKISAGNSSTLASAFTFSNGSGVSWGYDGTNITATVKTDYQSSGAYLTTAMQSNAATISNIKISAGASSTNASAFTFSNGSGVSWGYDGTNITASVATNYQSQGAYLTTARASNDGIGTATAQTNVTWTVNSNGLSLNAAGYAGTGTTFAGANISGSITHNSVGLNLSLSVAPVITAQSFANVQLGASNTTQGQNTVWLVPFVLPYAVNASTIGHIILMTGNSTSNTGSVGITHWMALYQQTATASSSRFDTIWSSSQGVTDL